MHLESTCIDMSAEKIQAILERSKPINYKWLISKIRKHLPELYSDLCLDFYNPYKNQCRVTKEECKILLPFFQKIHKELQAKYEKYKDIQEGGEATERQQNLLFKYENEAEKIDNVLSSIKDILK